MWKSFLRNYGVGKEAIVAEIEKKTIRNEKTEAKKAVSPTALHTQKAFSSAVQGNEDWMIYLLTKKDETIYHKMKQTIDINDLMDGTKKKLIQKLYDLYESGNIKCRSIESVCESEEEFSILTESMMKENTNGDYEKILTEVSKNYLSQKLTEKRKALMEQLGHVSTKEEEESIAVELNEINNQLGQLMVR